MTIEAGPKEAGSAKIARGSTKAARGEETKHAKYQTLEIRLAGWGIRSRGRSGGADGRRSG